VIVIMALDFDKVMRYVTGNKKFLEYHKNNKVICVYQSDAHKNSWSRII